MATSQKELMLCGCPMENDGLRGVVFADGLRGEVVADGLRGEVLSDGLRDVVFSFTH